MKTYNIELVFSSIEEERGIKEFLLSYREVCNEVSQILFREKNLYIKTVHKLCYYPLRAKYNNLPAQSIIRAEKEIIGSYKSIKSNRHKIDAPLIKKTASMRLDKRLYSSLTNESIKLSSPTTPKKRILVRFKLYDRVIKYFSKYQVSDPLLFVRNDKVYLSISFQQPYIVPKDESVLGIDLGLRRIATTSDGIAFVDKKYLKKKREIRYLKRTLQAKRTKSAKRHLKKLKVKEKNINKDFNHHLTNQILKTNKSIIVLEDLKKIKERTKTIKNTTVKRTKHNNRMSQVAFFTIKTLLEYKAPTLGKRVETVSPAYTSQNDCRGILNGIRKGCRYYASDGSVLDADWNAAINIAKRVKLPHSFPSPVDGKLVRQAVYQSAYRNPELQTYLGR